ncbi:MAG: hypothetical protein GY906_22945 [bacterium]|nr:hypothetical protein [bacterium]
MGKEPKEEKAGRVSGNMPAPNGDKVEVTSFRDTKRAGTTGDATGRVRVWITLRDRSGAVIPKNRSKTITVIGNVGEIARRIELALFGEELS